MADAASIAAAVSSVKTAFEIAKLVRESGNSLEKAEVKLRLAELMGAIADAKMELTQVQELLAEKDTAIRLLEDALEAKGQLVRRYDALYHRSASGEPEGDALCVRCWENDHVQRTLILSAAQHHNVCPTCKTLYDPRRSGFIAPK